MGEATYGGGAKCVKWPIKPFIEIEAKMLIFLKIHGDANNERTKSQQQKTTTSTAATTTASTTATAITALTTKKFNTKMIVLKKVAIHE